MHRILRADQVFDGNMLHAGACVELRHDGRIAALHPAGADLPATAMIQDLGAGVLAPGLVDLQVNGGGGQMVGAETDVDQLAHICAVHAGLGACAILPTLITDCPDTTRRVILAGIAAARAGVAGFAGLHLEGPHLDPARKGAHDASLIRPMSRADLALLCDAQASLPALIVTLAPESATMAQIAELAEAGVNVSLGHSGCSATTARAAYAAGARCVTHLYNAMGGMQSRAPGLVGAALAAPFLAGIIADGVHVADDCLRVAVQLKAPDNLFLVSDAMAVAGTSQTSFTLNGRQILRRDGQLTLADGTLAGADICLPGAIAHLVRLGVDLPVAMAMATRVPARVIGVADRGCIAPGACADLVFLDPDLRLRHVWQSGRPVAVGAVSVPE